MNDKKSELSLSDLERHLWEAAHIITGPIDASDYKTYIKQAQKYNTQKRLILQELLLNNSHTTEVPNEL